MLSPLPDRQLIGICSARMVVWGVSLLSWGSGWTVCCPADDGRGSDGCGNSMSANQKKASGMMLITVI